MIIRFHNLGKIKETELDLRPMTVIIGPNNSNKTYVAYSVYGLWKAQQRRFRSSLNFKVGRESRGSLEGQKQAPSTQIVFFVDVSPAFLNQVLERVRSVSERFCTELDTYFQDSSNKLFKTTSYDLQLSEKEIVDKLSQMSEHGMNIRQNESRFSFSVSYEQKQILVKWTNPEMDRVDTENEVSLDSQEKEAQELATLPVTSFLLNALFPNSFLLPAERNAFIITYKMLETRRYKIMREALRERGSAAETDPLTVDPIQEEPVRYPQPVEDFLDFLTDVEVVSTRIQPQMESAKAFGQVADMIEASIQNGNKMRYRPTVLGGKEIVINVGGDIDIDLYNASSSIKQLAPLILYLRYRARKNDLLIIDEPEMNLHPESQAKLMEALAMLVNHGVNVLLTTHSPYILAHLNNLAQGQETSQAVKNRQAKSLYLKNPGSLLMMEQVSAYEMRDNQLHSLKEEGYGIRWNTLSDVSVDLQQKYFEIYEEGHAKEKVKATRKTAKTAGGQNGQG